MPCALCLREAPLKKSHVIPEFLYKHMYDHKHRFHVVTSPGVSAPRLGQKGIRERLLCDPCEGLLSPYERYVSLVFSGQLPVQASEDGALVRIQGLDYKKFRLFGLSVLWRAGVSKHRMFSRVELGPHEETLRQMILHENPGQPHQYGFFLSPLLWDEIEVKDLILDPTRARLAGLLCYRFVFGGLIWVFTAGKHMPQTPVREAFINQRGQMLMMKSEIKDVSFIWRAMQSMAKNRRNFEPAF